MFYWLTQLSDGGDFFNLFRYITFRAGGAFFTALLFGFLFGRPLINVLRKKQGKGQPIRDDGPATHFEKAGTPTMGGLLILISLLFATCLWARLDNVFIWIVVLVTLSFGLIGDSGSYTLGLFTGIFLIDFAYSNNSISPYFIIILVWYPCFDLLFSMIRRLLKKIKTYEPDTSHLHHLVYSKIKKYFKIKNNNISHLFTNIVINIYNLLCFYISTKYIYSSKILVTIFLVNIFVYVSSYKYLKKKI